MLGRLFKSSSNLPTPTSPSQFPQNVASQSSPNSYEDAYMRTLLYGTETKFTPFNLNPLYFRLVICQDGSLRSKQVLYDSNHVYSHVGQNGCYNVVPKKQSSNVHNVLELNDYMFGGGLPTNDMISSTKLHVLPKLANSSHFSVLITRLFSITDDFSSKTAASSAASLNSYDVQPHDPDWDPKSTYPGKESTQGNITRLSIGLIIPIEDLSDLSEIFCQNWDEISFYLLELQTSVLKKLKSLLKSSLATNFDLESTFGSSQPTQGHNNGNNLFASPVSPTTTCTINSESSFRLVSPYIIHRRIQFPNFFLQGDNDLNSFMVQLVKLFQFNSNIPRLINGFTYHSNSFTKSWLSEILNWLIYKDGKPFVNNTQQQGNNSLISNYSKVSGFLPSLFAILIPLRHLLQQKPCKYEKSSSSRKDILRVVVMTGNPIVAKKLIFILNGLIPFDNNIEFISDTLSSSPNLSPIISNPRNVKGLHLMASLGSIDTMESSTIIESSPKLTATSAKAIPIRKKSSLPSSPDSQASFASSTPSSRGWEIPKLANSITMKSSIDNPVINGMEVIQPQGVNISTGTHYTNNSSLSNSSSRAYLSSSLSSSISSSNLSLSKLGTSFLDKWKSTMNLNGGVDSQLGQFPQPLAPFSNLKSRNSISSMRSPSPVIETDEFQWTGAPKYSISRTPSMFDISSQATLPNNVQKYAIPKIPAIERTKTLLIDNKNKGKCNDEMIKSRVLEIMESTPILSSEGSVLKVDGYSYMKYGGGSRNMSIDENVTLRSNRSSITSEANGQPEMMRVMNNDNDDENNNNKQRRVRLNRQLPLLHNSGFMEEFRKDFTIQSCPISTHLESHIINAMKEDINFYQGCCDYEKVSTRTLLISLRAREIKNIELETIDVTDDEGAGGYYNNGNGSSLLSSQGLPFYKSGAFGYGTSPTTSFHTPATQTGNKLGVAYNTSVKKIFSPSKTCGDLEAVSRMDGIFNEVNELFNDVMDESDFYLRMEELMERLFGK